MLNFLRRLAGRGIVESHPLPFELTPESIESRIRGLREIQNLRKEHGNWKGAKTCADEIAQLEAQLAECSEEPSSIIW